MIIEQGRVLANTQIGELGALVHVHAPGIAERASAGQFVHVRPGHGWDPLLRRPYSFCRIDRRAVGLDHLGDLAIPALRVEEGRIHRDVSERVARRAVALDFVEAGALFEFDLLLLRERGAGEENGGGSNCYCAHVVLPHALSVMLCITLLW